MVGSHNKRQQQRGRWGQTPLSYQLLCSWPQWNSTTAAVHSKPQVTLMALNNKQVVTNSRLTTSQLLTFNFVTKLNPSSKLEKPQSLWDEGWKVLKSCSLKLFRSACFLFAAGINAVLHFLYQCLISLVTSWIQAIHHPSGIFHLSQTRLEHVGQRRCSRGGATLTCLGLKSKHTLSVAAERCH